MRNLLREIFARKPKSFVDGDFVRSDLPKDGRSSKNIHGEAIGLGEFYEISGDQMPYYMGLMEMLATYNADLSHTVNTFIDLANTGHKIILPTASKAEAEKILEILNTFARDCYEYSSGMDGLVNHYLLQLLLKGAVSSEDILRKGLDGVDRVELVSPEDIYFKRQFGRFKPYQRFQGQPVELNPITYRYSAHMPIKLGEPAGRPLLLAAMEAIKQQRNINESVTRMLDKLGLFGFLDVQVAPPPRERGETAFEYRARQQTALDNLKKAYSSALRDEVLVHYNAIETKHNSITGTITGAEKVYEIIRKQLFSGAGSDPALQGEPANTTKAYAGAIYRLLANRANTLRNFPKRRIERTWRLHLVLNGIFLPAKLKFNSISSFDPKAEAETEEIQLRNVMLKVEKGLVTPEQAAQELGYEEWADTDRLFQASYDAQEGAYNSLTALEPARRSAVFFEQRSFGKEDGDPELQKAVERFLRVVTPFLSESTDGAFEELIELIKNTSYGDHTEESFAETGVNIILDQFGALRSNLEFQKAIGEYYTGVNDIGNLKGSVRIQTFAGKTDSFFFSKYFANEATNAQAFDYFSSLWNERGADLWSRMSDAELAKFRKQFGAALGDISNSDIQRIMTTSTQSMRSYSDIMRFAETGVTYSEIYEPLRLCPICSEMHGKVVDVQQAKKVVDQILKMDPDEYLQHLRNTHIPSPEYIRGTPIGKLVEKGMALPPYHPWCHGRVIKYREVLRDGVNVAERGQTWKFTDPTTGKSSQQKVLHTVLDKYGQKVHVTNGYKQHVKGSRHYEMLDNNFKKTNAVLRNGDLYTSLNDAQSCYIHGNRMVITRDNDGKSVAWTGYAPDNLDTFKKGWSKCVSSL